MILLTYLMIISLKQKLKEFLNAEFFDLCKFNLVQHYNLYGNIATIVMMLQ